MRTYPLLLVLPVLASTALQPTAQAGTLHNNWNYAIDSVNDGVSGNLVGGGIFEFYSLALRETENEIIFAMNANLPIPGQSSSTAGNGSISYGDLFFNFSGTDFQSANKNLFAVRFTPFNDSGVTELGVFSNVTAKSVTGTNEGFSNLAGYNQYVQSNGGNPSQADLAATDSYFDQTGIVLNSIATGTKIGNINRLSLIELNNLDLDFGYFGATGSQTLGFSFAKSLFPTGNFLATIFAECANDGMTLQGIITAREPESETVPEPSVILGLVTVGLLLRNRKSKHR